MWKWVEMAVKKRKGMISPNYKRTINGEEVKPTLYVSGNGKKRMCGTVNGEIVRDNNGYALPFQSIIGD